MKPLLAFTDRHAITIGVAGSGSAFLSWLLSTLHDLAGLVADLSIFVGFGIGLLTLVLVAHRVKHRNDLFPHRPIWQHRPPYDPLDPDDRLP